VHKAAGLTTNSRGARIGFFLRVDQPGLVPENLSMPVNLGCAPQWSAKNRRLRNFSAWARPCRKHIDFTVFLAAFSCISDHAWKDGGKN
jgi:hypothetical protein